MGYFSNSEVAGVVEPQKITLARNPNFIQFLNKGNANQNKKVKLILEVIRSDFSEPEQSVDKLESIVKAKTMIKIKESQTGVEYSIRGTYDKALVNSTTFFVARAGDEVKGFARKLTGEQALGITARNVCACLASKPFFRNNYDMHVSVDIVNGKDPVKESCSIEITSKGSGARYDFSIIYMRGFFKDLSSATEDQCEVKLESVNTDTIDSGSGDFRIELDIYTDTGVFLGENSLPAADNQGKYLTSVAKTYFEKSIWFDPNVLISRKVDFSAAFLEGGGWHNAGTVCDYRFVARRASGIIHEPFYYSDVLYVVNGYDYTLSPNNLDGYVFDVNRRQKMKPLSNRPATTHVKGQKHYFNFILKDVLHSSNAPFQQSVIGLLYRFKTQSGAFIAHEMGHLQSQKRFDIVNTIEIGLDKIIDRAQSKDRAGQKTIGMVEIMLCCDGVEVSEPLVFNIHPHELHRVNEFVFLNRLGGWDSFGFGKIMSSEFKAAATTIYKNVSPGYKAYDQIESVAFKDISEQYIAKTDPVSHEIAEWLRELGSSVAVYHLSTKRYIIIDDFTQKYNPADDLFEVEIKFHYTDSFNGGYPGNQ